MKQRGFSLIMVTFLLVVLGGIAVFVSRVSGMQHHSSALDQEGAMAYQAARAGIEWGVYQALVNASCVAAPTAFTLPVPTTPDSIVDYTVIVTCATPAAAVTEGLRSIGVYNVTATASNSAVGNFRVERRLTATVAKCLSHCAGA